MILFQRPGHDVKLNTPFEISWDQVVSNADPADCIEMNSNEKLSGTFLKSTVFSQFFNSERQLRVWCVKYKQL